MASRIDLLDVNVWLALSSEDHVHHDVARQYWENHASEEIAFCRLTMLGLLRLTTNSSVMAGRPFTPSEAWLLYRGFRKQDGVILLEEPSNYEVRMAAWSDQKDFSSQRWTDCALASWAYETKSRMVSFDSGFSRFERLTFLHLSV